MGQKKNSIIFKRNGTNDIVNDKRQSSPNVNGKEIKHNEDIQVKFVNGKNTDDVEQEKIEFLKRLELFSDSNKHNQLDNVSIQHSLEKEKNVNPVDKKLIDIMPEISEIKEQSGNGGLSVNERSVNEQSGNGGLSVNERPVKNQKTVEDIISGIIPDFHQQPIIEVENVNLTFDITYDKIDNIKEKIIKSLKRHKTNIVKFRVLNEINLKIYKGEKVGIIGYNGAGKSTLLNVICGIYPADTGFVKTYGNISPLLLLGAGFDYNYSGRKNIFLNGAVLGYDKKYIEEKLDEIIEFSELGEFIDIPIKNYSSGMLAKLGFSIATAVNPDILIIDEILGVGDVNFQRKCSDKIKSLMDTGTTVLLVSHSLPQIRKLCDKAIWIDKGSIRAIGEVNEICDSYIKDSEKATNKQIENIQFR